MATRAYAVVFLAALLSTAQETSPPAPAATRWIVAARDHQPGTIDEPLLDVSGWQGTQFDAVRRDLGKAVSELGLSPLEHANVLRRGVLLHTDIALLTPARAASFTHLPPASLRGSLDPRRRTEAPQVTSVIVGSDGQFLSAMAVTAHWSFARALAAGITADPSRDPFVRDWYRAIACRFMALYSFGLADPHLEDARKLLPHDPWILFYSAALHEAYASSRAQNILRSGPMMPFATTRPVRGTRAELETAADYFRKAVAADPGLVEARVRWGRVLGLLGRHREAIDELRRGRSLAETWRLQYLAELFLGAELGELGERDEARRAFERAAALFPMAQSPWIGLSALARRAGDRQSALEALHRLMALPAESEPRDDPWWHYFRSYAFNADELLQGVREPFLQGGAR